MKKKFLLYPYNFWMAIFVLTPLVLILFFSFTNDKNQFTLENLVIACGYSSIFLKSIWLAAVSTIVCLLIGYPVAYCVSKISCKYQNIFLILLMIPMWTNFLLRTYAWMTILEYNGLLNSILNFLGFSKINMINTQGAVILGMVYNFLPYMILPIYTILDKMDKRAIEAAQDLGANRIKVFTKVILPLSVPGIVSGFTMVFVPSVSTFIISKILGGGSIFIIGDLIEMQFLGNVYNPHLGSAISLILMIIIMLCMATMNQGNRIQKL